MWEGALLITHTQITTEFYAQERATWGMNCMVGTVDNNVRMHGYHFVFFILANERTRAIKCQREKP